MPVDRHREIRLAFEPPAVLLAQHPIFCATDSSPIVAVDLELDDCINNIIRKKISKHRKFQRNLITKRYRVFGQNFTNLGLRFR